MSRNPNQAPNKIVRRALIGTVAAALAFGATSTANAAPAPAPRAESIQDAPKPIDKMSRLQLVAELSQLPQAFDAFFADAQARKFVDTKKAPAREHEVLGVRDNKFIYADTLSETVSATANRTITYKRYTNTDTGITLYIVDDFDRVASQRSLLFVGQGEQDGVTMIDYAAGDVPVQIRQSKPQDNNMGDLRAVVTHERDILSINTLMNPNNR